MFCAKKEENSSKISMEFEENEPKTQVINMKNMFANLLALTPLVASQNDCAIDHAIVGIYAVRMDTEEVLIDQNSDLSLNPGSCMKIVTTGAALHVLGVDARFITHLEYDGLIEEGTLHGNLYIKGGGDPCLGSDRIVGSLPWMGQIEVWRDAIQKLGIRKIVGKVIGDASSWEKALAAPSWLAEDLGNYYGAGASALSFHENSYLLTFKPGAKEGDPALILRTEPPILGIDFQNEVKTGPLHSGDQACIYGSEFSPLQFIRGTVPAAEAEFSIKGAIPDPASLASRFLRESLRKGGISIEGNELTPQNPRVPFHATSSPTIGEIVHWTNQKSVNLYAEHLLKQMGKVVYNEASTAAGIKAVTDFWNREKIDLGGFKMFDGSGLSRKNLITAKQLVRMLHKMKGSIPFPIFFESLPTQENGIQAKSGSMSQIKAYAGYAGPIAFAIMVNNSTDPKTTNEKIKAFLSQVSHFDEKQSFGHSQ
jgi:serine-type D-Ala-D-Ala carboxypeptidase/endopeptidase (penicillin-binding protein 4)